MLISEPYLLSLRKSLMLFDCTVGECSELPILYSIVNYPRKTWRAKLVLSTGLIFFLSFFFFLFFLFTFFLFSFFFFCFLFFFDDTMPLAVAADSRI